ncbi:MAG: hypothetical protein ACRD1T_02620 [Acidimicrobiia bacterium]
MDQVKRTVFLAITNYPEDLGPLIINRPSRFDKRFFIGHPKDAARHVYFRRLLKGKITPDESEMESHTHQQA